MLSHHYMSILFYDHAITLFRHLIVLLSHHYTCFIVVFAVVGIDLGTILGAIQAPFWDRFWDDFGTSFKQISTKNTKTKDTCSNMLTRSPQDVTESPQDGPRVSQDDPKMSLIFMSQNASKMLQDRDTSAARERASGAIHEKHDF